MKDAFGVTRSLIQNVQTPGPGCQSGSRGGCRIQFSRSKKRKNFLG
jgi:hypothetical protein